MSITLSHCPKTCVNHFFSDRSHSAGLPTPFLPGGPAPLPAFPDPTVCPGFPGSPPPPPEVLPWPVRGTSGDPGNMTTLDHVLTVDGALPDVRIRDVMSVESGMLCYEYV